MKIIEAKMKSLTKSYGEDEFTVLNYQGQECILINSKDRKFVFDSDDGKLFVFISSNDSRSIKEKYGDNEIEIEFLKNGSGKLKMSKMIGKRKMHATFNVMQEIFKVNDQNIHIKYKILDEKEFSYLTEVEIFIEIGGKRC